MNLGGVLGRHQLSKFSRLVSSVSCKIPAAHNSESIAPLTKLVMLYRLRADLWTTHDDNKIKLQKLAVFVALIRLAWPAAEAEPEKATRGHDASRSSIRNQQTGGAIF